MNMDPLVQISDVLARVKWMADDDTSASQGAGREFHPNLSRLSKALYRNMEKPTDSESRRKRLRKKQKEEHLVIAKALVKLIRNAEKRNGTWPLSQDLEQMILAEDSWGRLVGAHVVAVLASINALLPDSFSEAFFVSSGKSEEAQRFDKLVRKRARDSYNVCWGENPPFCPLTGPRGDRPSPGLFGATDTQQENAKAFLRVCALYHDMGKKLSTEHHVPRGVHIMRDTGDARRMDMERLFDTVSEKNRFWAVLGHHDVFGVLTTGEASLPALADMIGWTSDADADIASGRSSLAQIGMLNWLNVADSNAAMITNLGGLTTSEAHRYFGDWWEIHGFLTRDVAEQWPPIGRDTFKRWSLEVGSRPDKTIQRIARLIATCHQYVPALPPIDFKIEQTIQRLVEQELQALHGPRFEHFCYRFARFCKLDYGLSFFKELMKQSLKEQEGEAGIRRTVGRMCAILHRIVDEYGHLVDGDPRMAPRLGVDMSKLTNPHKTAESICSAMRENEAGALRWIIDEISIWLYGD
jgi:hypothetical protein